MEDNMTKKLVCSEVFFLFDVRELFVGLLLASLNCHIVKWRKFAPRQRKNQQKKTIITRILACVPVFVDFFLSFFFCYEFMVNLHFHVHVIFYAWHVDIKNIEL